MYDFCDVLIIMTTYKYNRYMIIFFIINYIQALYLIT